MDKLLTSNLFQIVREELTRSDRMVYVISPFISVNTLTALLHDLNHNDVTVVTSWRKDHLLSGASSIDLFPLCEGQGWNLYINDHIHAKLYSRDLQTAFVGSSNCTERGLSDNSFSNIECMVFIEDLRFLDRCAIDRMILDSTLVTHEIWQAYRDWLSTRVISKEIVEDDEVIETGALLYTSQLPATDSPLLLWGIINNPDKYDVESQRRAEHDLALFAEVDHFECYQEFINELSRRFVTNPFIERFLEYAGNEIFFGSASAWVHKTCQDDPAPYRKEIKMLVSNLFTWIPELMANYTVSVPGQASKCLSRSSK